MATTTTRLALRKPDPTPGTGDDVDAALDINANADKIDAAVGAIACTSGARPGAPYNGQFARETDTGNLILWNGAAWKRVFFDGPQERWPELIRVNRTNAADGAFSARLIADSQDRLIIRADGRLVAGSGAIAGDTELYRSAADRWFTPDTIEAPNTPEIFRQTLVATAATIDFTSIATSYREIQVTWRARNTDAGFAAQGMRMRINNSSTAADYLNQVNQVSGATYLGTFINGTVGYAEIGLQASAAASAKIFGTGKCTIVSWSAPTQGHLGVEWEATLLVPGTGTWKQNGGFKFIPDGPYNRITFHPAAGNFAIGTDIQLKCWR